MALVNLAKTVPDLPSDHILVMHKASLPPPSNKHRINSTTSGPSWCQVLLQLDPLPPASRFPAIVGLANRMLSKGDLWVNSCYTAYGGIALLITCVVTQAEIDLIATAVMQTLTLPMPAAASLPTSWSYLNIVDVPYFVGTDTPLTSLPLYQGCHGQVPSGVSFYSCKLPSSDAKLTEVGHCHCVV
jgi:hypothetical protein